MTNDIFGVKQFYPSIGLEWFSTAWANGKSRTLNVDDFDPYDTRCGYHRGGGNAKMIINGDGTVTFPTLSTTHRVFVRGPNTNVEQTIYARLRGKISAFQLRTRSNHHGVQHLPYGVFGKGTKEGSCGFGCYENSWTISKNKVGTELEVIHDLYNKGVNSAPSKIPKKIWVGFKQICRTVGGNNPKIKLEAYMLRDVTNQDGWTKEIEFTFDGKNAPVSAATLKKFQYKTKPCIDKGDKLGGDINAHQLRLLPGYWGGFIRMNDAKDIDLKFYSVREIAPL